MDYYHFGPGQVRTPFDRRRNSIYTCITAQVIADLEAGVSSAFTSQGTVSNIDLDIKLLVSQMTNEVAACGERRVVKVHTLCAEHDAEVFFDRTGAQFAYEGDCAFYDCTDDIIYFPRVSALKSDDNRTMAKARELVHWTGHATRLNRIPGPLRYRSEGHARERLVGEFGAAYLCTLLEITPTVSKFHAASISGSLRVLKTGRRAAMCKAASDAALAVEYLHLLQQHIIVERKSQANTEREHPR